jgi:drug/metabolite transporter (DMT)-like permease
LSYYRVVPRSPFGKTYAELAPFWVASTRFVLAALVFWGVAFFQKIPLPKGRALAGAVIFGAPTVGLGFLLISWGLVATPASLAMVLMAMVPLWTVFLSALQGVESLSWRGLFGSLLAVLGIAYIVRGEPASDISLPHIAAILIATLFNAEAGVLIKKFPPNPPVMTNAVGMTVGAFILGIASLLSREKWTIPQQARTWTAYIYLVLFVTVLAFFLYMFVLSKWKASTTSYGFVLTPLVTIVVASSLAGEVITPAFLVGAALVLAGVLVGALLPSKTRVEAVEECKDRSGQVLPRCT